MTSKWNGGSGNGGRGTRLTQIGTRMNDPIIDSLKKYWETLRAGRVAPYRSEIDPRQFEHALENVFILEIIGDANIRVRLAGMRLCEMMGMEVRGMNPRAFMMPEDRDQLDAAVLDVVGNTSVVEFSLETVDYNGKLGSAQLLLMPLRSDFGEITRILGCISDSGEAYEAPVRFRIKQKKHDRIEFTRSDDDRPSVGFGEPQNSGFTPSPAETLPQFSTIEGGLSDEAVPTDKERSRDHLRLVDSED